jgi:hypothetical protein
VVGRARGLTVLAAIALLSGCGSGAKGVSVHVDHDPFRVSVSVDGKTVVAKDRTRLRYQRPLRVSSTLRRC